MLGEWWIPSPALPAPLAPSAGKDHRDAVRRVAFYSDAAPRGLAQGKLLRWRNPRFHWFMDGSSGARIEDEDLPDISVVSG